MTAATVAEIVVVGVGVYARGRDIFNAAKAQAVAAKSLGVKQISAVVKRSEKLLVVSGLQKFVTHIIAALK